MPALPVLALALVQTGGTTPARGRFGYGAGLILVVVVAMIVGLVLIGLIRAGQKRH
ncbi:MAG TPA: hypothetical protein VMA34_16795 [Terracidiphilus sp.]|nr:hypothetical protein [Terracidiphilus sp.]